MVDSLSSMMMAYEIEKLTGIQLALSACRDFMPKRLGMKYRKMAVIPL